VVPYVDAPSLSGELLLVHLMIADRKEYYYFGFGEVLEDNAIFKIYRKAVPIGKLPMELVYLEREIVTFTFDT
jgi:hypothetical protein